MLSAPKSPSVCTLCAHILKIIKIASSRFSKEERMAVLIYCEKIRMTPCIPKHLIIQKLSFLTQDKKTQRCKLEGTAFPPKVNLCLNMLVIHRFLVTAFANHHWNRIFEADSSTGSQRRNWASSSLYAASLASTSCNAYHNNAALRQKGIISVWMPFMLAWRLKRNFVPFTRCCLFLERIDALTLWKKWYWPGLRNQS